MFSGLELLSSIPHRLRRLLSSWRERAAFTLIELLVVVGIIGTLASIVIYAINPSRQLDQSVVAANEARANQLEKAVIQYLIDGNALSGVPTGISNAANICTSDVTGTDCTDISGVDLSALVADYVPVIDAGPNATDGQKTSQLCIYKRGSFYDICVVGQGDCGCGGNVVTETEDGENTDNDNSAGNVAWVNPELAKTQDDSFAYVNLNGGNSSLHSSEYLLVQKFDFSVPTSATILGIEVEVDKHSVNSGVQIEDAAIRLIDDNGTIQTTDKATATAWSTTDSNTYVSYGGGSDLWSDTWTPAQVNSTNFGLALRAQTTCDPAGSCGGTSAVARVDHVRISVYYQTDSCFLPGTLVTLADGSTKPIEDIEVGDKVLGMNPSTGIVASQTVVRTMERESIDYRRLQIGDRTLRVTDEHPFYVGGGEYIEAKRLLPGDIVYVWNDESFDPAMVFMNEYVADRATVHNIETDGHHNFIADGVLVHNKSVASSSVSSGYGG